MVGPAKEAKDEGLLPVRKAWKSVCDLHPLQFNQSSIQTSLATLIQHNQSTTELLRTLLVERMVKIIRNEIVPTFWRKFQGSSSDDLDLTMNVSKIMEDDEPFSNVHSAISYAHNVGIAMQHSMASVDELIMKMRIEEYREKLCICDQVREMFTAAIFNATVPEFRVKFKSFFGQIFANHLDNWNKLNEEPGSDDDHDLTVTMEDDLVRSRIQDVGIKLRDLNWLTVTEEAFTEVIYDGIDQKIQTTCADQYDTSMVETMVAWMDSAVIPWLKDLLSPRGSNDDMYEQWEIRLKFHMFETLGTIRIQECFDIIKEFPDSIPALEDLKQCLRRTMQHRQLVNDLRESLKRRLLQPGANTSQIIDIYISTIKSLRIVDPRGILLEDVSVPIKEYLRIRKDTVRCIVSSLTEDNTSELFEELGRGDLSLIQPGDDSEDEETNVQPRDWEPDPIEANPKTTSKSRCSDDILAMMVSIYGSKELFVDEYRFISADKLLLNLDYNTDRELRTLELLKLRFGEDSLKKCEIMVKDIDDSKRINQNIHASIEKNTKSSKNTIVDATIVSKNFWPPFQTFDVTLHPAIAQLIDVYKDTYSVLKKPRSLEWIDCLGTVELELEFEGSTHEYQVTPFQATVIKHFEDQKTWSLSDLAEVMATPESNLSKKAMFWIHRGVLQRSPCGSLLSVVDDLKGDDGDGHARYVNFVDDVVETAVSVHAQKEESLKVFEAYIMGMLKNYGTLEISRIHNHLSTFARGGDHSYNKSIPELARMLAKMIQQGKIECLGNQYQLKK